MYNMFNNILIYSRFKIGTQFPCKSLKREKNQKQFHRSRRSVRMNTRFEISTPFICMHTSYMKIIIIIYAHIISIRVEKNMFGNFG